MENIKIKEVKEYWWDKIHVEKELLLDLRKRKKISFEIDVMKRFTITLSKTPSLDIWEDHHPQEDGFVYGGHKSIYFSLDYIVTVMTRDIKNEILKLEKNGFEKKITCGKHGIRIIFSKEYYATTTLEADT